jgi:hypothetical protein
MNVSLYNTDLFEKKSTKKAACIIFWLTYFHLLPFWEKAYFGRAFSQKGRKALYYIEFDQAM